MKKFLCWFFGHKYFPFVDSPHHMICLRCGKELWEKGYMRPIRKKNDEEA